MPLGAWLWLAVALPAPRAAHGGEYVFIPAATLEVGCVPSDRDCQIDETPRHPVRLSRGYWIATTEVTVGDYRAFAAATRRRLPPAPSFDPDWRRDDHPMVNVTWFEAARYCEWSGGHLPTEAEWEHAARAGREARTYFWAGGVSGAVRARPGNTADRAARRKYVHWEDAASDYDDGYAETAPVGRFAPNAWGLHDMAGNALEWCADVYHRAFYRTSPATDPKGPPAGGERSLRGGSWQDPHSLLRISDRFHYRPLFRASYVGFRCVRPDSAAPVPPPRPAP